MFIVQRRLSDIRVKAVPLFKGRDFDVLFSMPFVAIALSPCLTAGQFLGAATRAAMVCNVVFGFANSSDPDGRRASGAKVCCYQNGGFGGTAIARIDALRVLVLAFGAGH
jgi:hypothetical protein